jgi:hypothetical protein
MTLMHETRGTRLLGRDPDRIGRLLTHPAQQRAWPVIESLIGRLRRLREWSEYSEFQRLLFMHVYQAQEALREATRNVKRLKQGKTVPDTESGDWLLEQAVFDRVNRQLRAVGDALAWRLFSFDRRILLALSRNDPAGPMVGKAGLDRELGEVQGLWEREGIFALLHDLTNSLRIADLTRFDPEGKFIVEVKTSGHIGSAQEQRMRRAIDVVMSGAPLPGKDGDSDLVVSPIPFRTKLKLLENALVMSERDGVAAVRAGHQWVITCLFLKPGLLEEEAGDVLKDRIVLRDQQFRKASMHLTMHHLRGVRVDRADSEPLVAPPTILPFDARTCAFLTCDLMAYESVLGWDRLASAFAAAGFKPTCRSPRETTRKWLRPRQSCMRPWDHAE